MKRAFALALTATLLMGCGSFKRWSYAGGDRDEWQQPDAVVDSLAIVPGGRVADLGAGGGYFTFRLSDAVGSSGKVFAIDVDPDMTSYLEEEAVARGVDNVEVVLAEFDDPRLPEDGVDLVFSVNTYHHLQDRDAYFGRISAFLRPGGRIAIIEYKGTGWFTSWFGHATPEADIVKDLEAAGFALTKRHTFLEDQHFLIFEPVHANQ